MKAFSCIITSMALGGALLAPLASAQTKGPIGISMPTKSATRWILDGDNMVKLLNERSYKTELQFAADDVPTQRAQIQSMIDLGVKVLVIGAIDGSALTDVLEKAHNKRIKVIAYDRLLRGSENVDYYATFDNFQVGVLQAGFIETSLGLNNGKGPFNIELFAGSADDSNAHFFYNGAMSVLKPYIDGGKLVVRSKQMGLDNVATVRWDGNTAKARLEKVLGTYYGSNRLDAVLSPYDGISIGILSALKGAGYGAANQPYPVVTGQDAELPSIKSIIRGEQASTIFKDTRDLAEVISRMVDAMARGRVPEINDTATYNNGVKVVPAFLLKPVVVDQANYRQVLVTDSEYYLEAQFK